jgi:NAD(P)-dependent dehydrogenase (short-subunit alcohol dehydrogenase family)
MSIVRLLYLLLFFTSLVAGEQKVVLISGATGGVGAATVEAFQQKGWKVWAGYRSVAKIPQNLKNLLNVNWVELDVTSAEMVNSTIQLIIEKDGRIDALINNAGYAIIAAEEATSIEDAQKLFDVNFFGPLRLIHTVAPHMRKQHSGYIINISSGAGVRAIPGVGIYSASKFALEGLSEALAVELSPWNIEVSIVEPGTINNDGNKHCIQGSRTCNEPIYKKLAHNFRNQLAAWAQTAQSSNDVASIIVQITETSHPNLRYQTSQRGTDIIGKKLVDPTGNAMREEQIRFFRELIN